MYVWDSQGVVCIYIFTRRGLFRVAYLSTEAMREPECWDKHDIGTLLPRLFLYPYSGSVSIVKMLMK